MDKQYNLSIWEKVSMTIASIIFFTLTTLLLLLFMAAIVIAPDLRHKVIVLFIGFGWWLCGFLLMKAIIQLEGGGPKSKIEKWKIPAWFGILGLMLAPIVIELVIKEAIWEVGMQWNWPKNIQSPAIRLLRCTYNITAVLLHKLATIRP